MKSFLSVDPSITSINLVLWEKELPVYALTHKLEAVWTGDARLEVIEARFDTFFRLWPQCEVLIIEKIGTRVPSKRAGSVIKVLGAANAVKMAAKGAGVEIVEVEPKVWKRTCGLKGEAKPDLWRVEAFLADVWNDVCTQIIAPPPRCRVPSQDLLDATMIGYHYKSVTEYEERIKNGTS